MDSALSTSPRPAGGGARRAQAARATSRTLTTQRRVGTAGGQRSCARLIRVDFIAAGDLLNWVLSRGSESRAVHFVDAHRLVALFFGAMGINEHAKVQVRKV